jgi:hypothetical protein
MSALSAKGGPPELALKLTTALPARGSGSRRGPAAAFGRCSTSTAPYRWTFLFGVALVAAAIGNACVETVSNSGYLGAGYHDDDHVSVVPAIAGGCVLLVQIAIVRVLALLRGAAGRDGDWFARTATDISRRGAARDLPVLLAAQFCALYVMEACESLLASGHLPIGTAWLGGPPIYSIVAHVALGVLCAVLFARAMRAVVTTLASVVRHVIRLRIAIVPRAARASRLPRNAASNAGSQTPNARPFGGRAPPHHASLVPV